MDESKDQLDVAIDHKLSEVKELLLAREVRDRLSQLTGMSVVVPGLPLQLGVGVEKEKPTRKKPGPKAKAARAKAIAKSAAKVKKTKRGGKKGATRRKFTTAFKLQVLAEAAEAELKQDVLDKHNLYPSHLVTWARQRDAGKLDPNPLEPENDGTLELQQPNATTNPPDDETPDLVSELGGGERPHVPFAGAPTQEELNEFSSS